MKIYLLKAFDIACFRTFTPSPAGFTSEETAKAYVDVRNAEENDVFYAYDEVELSEMPADELKKANEKVAEPILLAATSGWCITGS
jgi:hypothetical protein